MPSQLRSRFPVLLIVLMTGCVTSNPLRQSPNTEQTACDAPVEDFACENAPAFLLGQFEDDYGIEYRRKRGLSLDRSNTIRTLLKTPFLPRGQHPDTKFGNGIQKGSS